jgi:hypothetical protein
MKFEYLPQKVGLQHTFRYIEGVLFYSGINNLSSELFAVLKINESFKELITQGAVILENNEGKINEEPISTPEPVVTKTTVVDSKPNVVPIVFSAKVGDLTEAEAIAMVNKATTVDQLTELRNEENSTKQRKKVFDTITSKSKELEVKK